MIKHGFSLIELLISLIIISLLSALFAPVITKGFHRAKITINQVSCTTYGQYCKSCNNKECKKCESNYILSSDKKSCISIIQDIYPSVENCRKINAVFIPSQYNGINGKDLCVSSYNAGDIGGPTIDKTTYFCTDGSINNRLDSKNYSKCIARNFIAIKDVSDNTACQTGACCWQGKTGPDNNCTIQSQLSSIKSNSNAFNYESCNRTVCNWYAAEGICKNYSYINGGIAANQWRLPTGNEIMGWKENINNVTGYQGSNGLQLCDASTSNLGSPKCGCNVNGCRTSGSTNCKPYCLWSQDEADLINAYRFNFDNGAITRDVYDKPVTCSIRCVIEKFSETMI